MNGTTLDRPVAPYGTWRRFVAQIAALGAGLAGVSVLLGWAFDVPALRSVIPGAVQMKANTAVALLASAIALGGALHEGRSARRAAALVLSGFVVLVGALTLWQYLAGVDLRVDELLVRDTGNAYNPAKGRMSPYTAGAFVALGVATGLLALRRGPRIVQVASGLVSGVGVTAITGYVWNASDIVTDRVAPPVALNTALAFVLLGVATFLLATRARGQPSRQRARIEALLFAAFIPALLLVFVGGGVTYRAAADFASTAALVAHTQQVRGELGRLLAVITDAEVAARNFLVTRDPSFQRRLDSTSLEARSRGSALREMVADNPAQQARAEALQGWLDLHLGALRERLGTAANDDAAVRERLASYARSDVDQRVRRLIRTMDDVEHGLLESRLSRSEAQRAAAVQMLLATTLLAGLVVLVLFRSIRREMDARRIAEDELRQSNTDLEKARLDSEAASRAKSAFLANMSHEIRTPMNAIIGLTYLMRREASDATQRDRLEKVNDSAQHLLQLINDILDMSKVEAGKMALEQTEFSLEALVASATEMVGGKAREKGLELILDTADLPMRLVGDPTRLSQILINLLSNAVKFTEHGWVRLRASVVAEEDSSMLVRFEVQDTGPGIPAERQAVLFKPFEQVDSSISRQHGGTGLGLALTRELARAMGGDAGVSSSPGAGSTFWVTVRLGRGSAGASGGVVSLRGQRVLLVDDLPESLVVIGERLRSMQVEVEACASGIEAIERVQQARAEGRGYDALVVDWQMEPLDGLETLGRLRRVWGGSTPPALMITAFDDPSLVRRAAAAGYEQVLLKPITGSALHDALAELLRRRVVPRHALAPTSSAETRLREEHAGRRILLAEDNPLNRLLAEEILRGVGLVVETAGDGVRAVEMATAGDYDLVLMDMQMPRMSGLEATRAIRSAPGLAMPIIAMTANAFMEDREACLAAGMDDHVTKPVDPDTLFTTLLRWLPAPQRDTARGDDSVRPDAAKRSLARRLEGVDGLDVAAGLRHVSNQPAVLERALQYFAASYRGGLPELLDGSGDDTEVRLRWQAVCHSMRSALQSVGASALAEQMMRLEADLKASVALERLADRARAIHEAVRRLADELATRL
ncbi:response regulator [Piscinibacter koreensis]|uniref:Virulence sensor protein BvgS n=1 Tax=Piscinibacter koreensis TaxID=2742824 RepID=A0A7Y6NS10_9BURK|nr:response regulator [Schlegelella koreensis]NUZ08292.1 response regulator [Schlegelella koreensis]